MAVLDKDRPRGLRVPSLSAIKAFSKSKSPENSNNNTPSIQLPAPSQLSLQSDSIPLPAARPIDKALPPNPLPSSPPQHSLSSSLAAAAPVGNSQHPPSPQSQSSLSNSHQAYQPFPGGSSVQPLRNDASYPPRQSSAAHNNTTLSQPAPRLIRKPAPAAAPVPASVNNPIAVQQRTPPSSEGEAEQRHSNATNDSLEDFIPDPEPEAEAEAEVSHEPGSSEDDDNRPWTPPEVDPVVVPLTNLHYSCYQDHRAMPVASNVWYALPCMTCHKFDRDIRHRCVFCCLRVCAECFQALQKCPRRSLAVLMESITVNGADAEA